MTVTLLSEDTRVLANSGDGDSFTRTAICNLAVHSHDAHTERSTESREESWKQRFRRIQTSVPNVRNVRSGRQRGIVQIMTYKFDSKIEDVEDRLNEFLELVRRYDGTRSRPSEKGVAQACEDTSSSECGETGKLQRITRGE